MRRSMTLNPGSGRTRRRVAGLALILALPLGCGTALAASCPSFPAPIVQFTPMPDDMTRDTGKNAVELGTAAKPMPVRYERQLESSLGESVLVQTEADGTVCAMLKEVEVKIGFKQKVYVASEFAGDGCVADTIADFAMPLAKSDDAALAGFGFAIGHRYAADFLTIGSDAERTPDDAKKALAAKVAALWQSRIYPALLRALDDAAQAADTGHWQKAACNGATEKAFAAISAKSSAMTSQFQMPRQQVTPLMDTGGNNMMSGMRH